MFRHYIKTAGMVFRRRKFITFVNLFGITFTLVILLLFATILDHIFGDAPPEVRQNRTLGIYRANLVHEGDYGAASALPGYGLLDGYARNLPGAELFSISSLFRKSISYVNGKRIEAYLKYTDAEFWDILGFEFLSGRSYTLEEVEDGRNVAVINEATRKRFFGSSPGVGESIVLDSHPYVVVGVVDNVSMLRLIPFSDVWVPITTLKNYDKPHELAGLYLGMILAKSTDDFHRIRTAFSARIATADMRGNEPYTKVIAIPETKLDTIARMVFSLGRSTRNQTFLLIIAVISAGVLIALLPTINLVNLTVSRILERSDEIGIRKAFGATSRALAGQFLLENLILSIVGGILSVIVTFLVLGMVSSSGLIPYAEFRLNARIACYAVLFTCAFSLISGAYPAWRMSRMNPIEALRGRIS